MIIGIDYRLANSSIRGMARYAKEIVSCLMEFDRSNTYILYIDKELSLKIEYSDRIFIKKIKTSNFIIGEQICLSLQTFIDKLDILWSPYNTFPLFTNPKTHNFVTIHDLIFFHKPQGKSSFSQKIGRLYRKYCLILGKKRITHCFTDSMYSLSEIKEKLSIRNITLTYCCITDFYKEYLLYKQNAILGKDTPPFYFTVSGDAPSKNLLFVIQYFRKNLPETYLFIAGVSENSYLRQYASDYIVLLENNLPLQELIEYYIKCKVFLFLSLQEGFGIPILEALVCNAKIIASNRTSIPEVAGNCAILINPTSEEQFTKALEDIETFSIDEKYKEKHLLKYFSWESVAKIVYNVFIAK
jgi:glycosyltransferase involved in cell wall biosynthesis